MRETEASLNRCHLKKFKVDKTLCDNFSSESPSGASVVQFGPVTEACAPGTKFVRGQIKRELFNSSLLTGLTRNREKRLVKTYIIENQSTVLSIKNRGVTIRAFSIR